MLLRPGPAFHEFLGRGPALMLHIVGILIAIWVAGPVGAGLYGVGYLVAEYRAARTVSSRDDRTPVTTYKTLAYKSPADLEGEEVLRRAQAYGVAIRAARGNSQLLMAIL